MSFQTAPQVDLHPLHRASGSATYTTTSTKITATVNAPLEPTRRDELPEAAFLDIHIRPSTNPSGGPRERWLEDILARALRQVVLIEEFPRQVVRIGLQILSGDGAKERRVDMGDGRDDEGLDPGSASVRDVCLLPALLNSALLALVDGRVPLRTVCVAGLATVGVDGADGGKVVVGDAVEKEIAAGARSLHAMAFTAQGDVVLEESVGEFSGSVWEDVNAVLRRQCLGAVAKMADGEDEAMRLGEAEEGTPWLRMAVEESVRQAGAWRESG